MIDKKSGHAFQECPKELFCFRRQCGFRHGLTHQFHPSVACSLVDVERCVPGAQPWMPALLNISLRAAESVDYEVPQTLLRVGEIARRVHWTKNVILRDTSIECRDESCDPGFANQVVYVDFLQSLVTAKRQLSQTEWEFFRFL